MAGKSKAESTSISAREFYGAISYVFMYLSILTFSVGDVHGVGWADSMMLLGAVSAQLWYLFKAVTSPKG